MPTTRSNLAQTPVNSDTLNWTGDLATLADSLEVVVPCASQAAGDTIATARAAAGFAVSDSRPLFIYNTTTKTIQVKDSAGWRDLSSPLGVASLQAATTTSGSIGTSVTVINNVASYAFKGGRNYKIEWYFEYNGSTAGNYIDCSIHTCSTSDGASVTTGLTKLGGASLKIHDASVGHMGYSSAWFEPASNTTLQIKFTTFVWVGAGTVVISASATQPARYSITDMGAAV